MDGHIRPDKLSKIADGTTTLSAEEFEHMRQCSECVDAVADRVRSKYRPPSEGTKSSSLHS
jgi:hypothetical protein